METPYAIIDKTTHTPILSFEYPMQAFNYIERRLQGSDNFKVVNLRKAEPIFRHVSKTTRYEVLDRQGWCCNICGCRLKYGKAHPYPYPIAHIDHVHPFTQRKTYPNGEGNINESSNLQALCPECNLKKSKKEIN